MLQWLLKRWRKTPEDYEQEVYGRGGDAFERARLAEEEGAERDELYGEDVSVEEKEPEGAEPLREKEKKSYYEEGPEEAAEEEEEEEDRKSTRLNSSHSQISYAVFFLKQQE